MKNGTTTTASRATIVTATDKSGHEAGKPEEIAGEVASSYASNAATTDEAAQQQPSFHDQSVGTTTHSSADESVKLIGWDGDDDPENPKNLPFRRRWFITSVIRYVLGQDHKRPSEFLHFSTDISFPFCLVVLL